MAVLGFVAALFVRTKDPKFIEYLKKFDLSATIAAVFLVAVTIAIGIFQLQAAQRAEQTQDLGRLIEAMGGERGTRVLAIYGLLDYTETYTDTRGPVLRQLSAHARYLSRRLGPDAESLEAADFVDELRITLGALKLASKLQRSSSAALPFDLANVDFRTTPMPGMILQSGTVVQADLSHVDLQGAEFTCTYAEGAKFAGANLKGARFRSVDLTRADFDGAQGIDKDTFTEAFWTDPPKWGNLPESVRPRNSPGKDLSNGSCEAKYGIEQDVNS